MGQFLLRAVQKFEDNNINQAAASIINKKIAVLILRPRNSYGIG